MCKVFTRDPIGLFAKDKPILTEIPMLHVSFQIYEIELGNSINLRYRRPFHPVYCSLLLFTEAAQAQHLELQRERDSELKGQKQVGGGFMGQQDFLVSFLGSHSGVVYCNGFNVGVQQDTIGLFVHPMLLQVPCVGSVSKQHQHQAV